MRATIAAATAALVGSTTAATLHHRHEAFHALAKKNPTNGTEVCGCTTFYSTYYGEPTLVFPPAPPPLLFRQPLLLLSLSSLDPEPNPSSVVRPNLLFQFITEPEVCVFFWIEMG